MHGLLRAALCAPLLAFLPCTWATTVIRCEDPQGRVTFTLHGCTASQTAHQQDARNPTPGSGKPVPLATPPRRAQQTPERIRFASTGQQQDGCGNTITGRERRQAIIKQQPKAGMTRRDVESALGKPDRTSQSNGQMRYHYKDRDGNTRQVSFDEQGCVKGKH